jgi:hypothetical protein
MRRPKLLVVLAVLAVIVAAGVVVLWPQTEPNRITSENCDRIKEGMSRAEVEAILGPPGDYRTSLGETMLVDGAWRGDWADYGPVVATWVPILDSQGRPSLPKTSAGIWKCDSIEILVMTADDSGRVLGASTVPRRRTGSPLDNLRWRLKRQWHRWFP